MAETQQQQRKIAAPPINSETQHFWDMAGQGKLLYKKCVACGEPHFYPRPHCPFCFSDKVEWQEASGRGTVYSYVVNHYPQVPAFDYPLSSRFDEQDGVVIFDDVLVPWDRVFLDGDTIGHDDRINRNLVALVGADRVTLGSDYCFDMGLDDPLATIGRMGLNEKDKALVAGGNALRLLRLPEPIQADLRGGRLTMGHALVLLSLSSEADQIRLRDEILAHSWTVRAAEQSARAVEAARGTVRRPKPARKRSAELAAVEATLQRALMTRVRIVGNERRGKIVVTYATPGELERLSDIFGARH